MKVRWPKNKDVTAKSQESTPFPPSSGILWWMISANQNFFRTVGVDPQKRYTGRELDAAYEHSVWMAKGHNDAPGVDKNLDSPSVEISALQDRSELKFNYSDGYGVATPKVTIRKTLPETEESPSGLVSLSMTPSADGKRLHVQRFEAFEGQSIGDIQQQNFIVDRNTGTLFQEVSTVG